MLTTNDLDSRAVLDELEEPLIQLLEVAATAELAAIDDGFDGICTQHEGCRVIR
ncbi:MAG: hypothetical protein QM675_08820 [Protaetiibacter sp.]